MRGAHAAMGLIATDRTAHGGSLISVVAVKRECLLWRQLDRYCSDRTFWLTADPLFPRGLHGRRAFLALQARRVAIAGGSHGTIDNLEHASRQTNTDTRFWTAIGLTQTNRAVDSSSTKI